MDLAPVAPGARGLSRPGGLAAALVLAALLAAACAPPASAPSDPSEAAIDALAVWLGPAGDRASIEVVSVDPVRWPDGCLGLGRAGQVCTDAIVPGYRVRLGLGRAVYEVRTDETGGVTAWAPQVQILVRFLEAGTNLVLLETDDGGRIDAQLVPGSSLGVDLASLRPGEAVGAALADAPQREGSLVVWLDPVTGGR